jgi:preprotein translocase subunit SecG
MYYFVVALHVLLCLILVGVILLQPGKGADPGSAFGGGMTSSVFGPRGPTNVLSQATTVVAVLFMVTSVSLALYSTKSSSDVDEALERLGAEEEAARSLTPPAGEAPAPEPSMGELDAVPAGE